MERPFLSKNKHTCAGHDARGLVKLSLQCDSFASPAYSIESGRARRVQGIRERPAPISRYNGRRLTFSPEHGTAAPTRGGLVQRASSSMTSAGPGGPSRIASLDQFRGYTVAGMLFVNFGGGFAALHPMFKHHNTY